MAVNNDITAVVMGDEVMRSRTQFSKKKTSLSVAYTKNSFKLLEVLIEHLKIDPRAWLEIFRKLLASTERKMAYSAYWIRCKMLTRAVQLGDLDIVKKLIDLDAEVDYMGCGGDTPLHVACRGHSEIVQVLLQAGARTDVYNFKRSTPLMEAVCNGDTDSVRLLVAAGADINCSCGEYGKTPLIIAVELNQVEIVNIFIENNVDLERTDYENRTALHTACYVGCDFVKRLLRAGSDIEANNYLMYTPFFLAFKRSDMEMMKLLIEAGANVNCINYKMKTPLFKAAVKEDITMIKFLIENGAELSALLWAARDNNEAIVDTFIAAECDVNYAGADKCTALVFAVVNQNINLVTKLIQNNAKVNVLTHYPELPPLISPATVRSPLVAEVLEKITLECREENTLLNIAIQMSSPEVIETLLQTGADVNALDEHGRSPLHIASMYGNLELVMNLLELCAKINTVDKFGNSPFFISILYKHKELSNFLLSSGAGVNLVCDSLCSSLYIAVLYDDTEQVRQLTQHGAIIQKSGESELLAALKNRNLEVAIQVLELGADPNVTDGDGQPALLQAFKLMYSLIYQNRTGKVIKTDSESLDNATSMMPHTFPFWNDKLNSEIKTLIMSFLSHNVGVLARDKEGNSCLHLATLFCSSDILELLIASVGDVDVQNQLGETPLMKACQCGNVDGAKCLIKNGANVSIRDKNQDTALHHCVRNNEERLVLVEVLINKRLQGDSKSSDTCLASHVLLHSRNFKGESACHEACRRGHDKIVELLLKNNCQCSLPDLTGNTPLMLALIYNFKNIAKLLIGCATFIQTSDEEGQTALHLAAWWSFKEVVFYLVKIGANVDAQNNQGETPLFLASDVKIADCLIKAKCNLNLQNTFGETALYFYVKCNNKQVAQLLIESGANLDLTSHEGFTPLIEAVRNRNFETMKVLVEHGANVNIQDREGRSPFTYMLLRKMLYSNQPHYDNVDKNICKYLVKNGADVNIRDKKGQTLCIIAVKNDRYKYLPELLSFGADLNIAGNENQTPLVHTLYKKNSDAILQLLQYGVNQRIDTKYRYLLQELAISKPGDCTKDFTIHGAISSFQMHFFQLFLANQVVIPHDRDTLNKCKSSNLSCSYFNFNPSFMKYMFATCFLFKSDLHSLRNDFVKLDCNQPNDFPNIKMAIREPWPLVKLAFIEVSTLLGTGPMREEKLKQTKLPPRLQTALMFQEPISRLPVEDWSKIPICFDPVQYETLPCPRPLLYYWPVGHRLVI